VGRVPNRPDERLPVPGRGGILPTGEVIGVIVNDSRYFGLEIDAIRTDDDTTTVRIRGELDLSTSNQLETDLLRLINERLGRRLVLDLSELTFLDSTGLRALWRTRQHAQEAGSRLFLKSASEPVMRILRTTKLDKVFSIVGTDPDLDITLGAG